MQVYWNKNYIDIKDKTENQLFDRAFHFGDGIYETIAVKQSKPVFIKEHMDRLFYDAKRIDIPINLTAEEILNSINKVIQKNTVSEGFIKIIITRGTMQNAGLSYPEPTNPSVFIWGQNCGFIPLKDKKPYKLVISEHERRNKYSLVTFVKTLNYLTNIIAKREADEKGCDEAILLNTHDHVCECTTANIFIIEKDGTIITPEIENGILNGVVRNKVILAALDVGMSVIEKSISVKDLKKAKGCFLTSSLIGITPVEEIMEIEKYDVRESFNILEILDSKYELL